MQLLTYKIPRNCRLIQASDAHIGTRFHHAKGFQKLIDTVKSDKNARIVFAGDLVEAIAVDDPRYDSDSNTQPVPFKQAEDLIEQLYPIRKQIVTILDGNHELKIKKHVNLSEFISKQLGVHYGTWTCKVQFTDNNNKPLFKAFFCHGHTKRASMSSNADDPIKRKSNEQGLLKRALYAQAGDCLYMGCGHYHKLITVQPSNELFLTDNGSEIQQSYTAQPSNDFIHPNLRFYGCSGAFLKMYQVGLNSYAEIAGYKPTEMGYLVLSVENGKLRSVTDVKV